MKFGKNQHVRFKWGEIEGIVDDRDGQFYKVVFYASCILESFGYHPSHSCCHGSNRKLKNLISWLNFYLVLNHQPMGTISAPGGNLFALYFTEPVDTKIFLGYEQLYLSELIRQEYFTSF